MKSTLLFLFICFSVFKAKRIFAQDQSNIAGFQFLGNGLLFSLNYERKLFPKAGLWAQGGIGMYYEDSKPWLTLPVSIKYFFPLNKLHTNYIGASAGVTYCKAETTLYAIIDYHGERPKSQNLNYVPGISFRHLNPRKHVSYTWDACLIGNVFGIFPYCGYTIGYTF